MQRNRTFEWRYTAKINRVGWRPANTPPDFYAGGPFLAAHDTIEHLSDKADWAHELRAQGVAIFGRCAAQPSYLPYVADDILGFASEQEFAVPAIAGRWAKPLKDARHEAALQAFLDLLRYKVDEMLPIWTANGMPTRLEERARTFTARVAPWLRRGYAGAMRIYGGNGIKVGRLHQRIEQHLYVDGGASFGDRIDISVDTCALTFKVQHRKGELSADERRERKAYREGGSGFGAILRALDELEVA